MRESIHAELGEEPVQVSYVNVVLRFLPFLPSFSHALTLPTFCW